MSFMQMCIQQMYQLQVPQTGGPSANSRLPSQGYQFERKIQGTQIVPLLLLLGLFSSACLNEPEVVSESAVSQRFL